MKEYEIGQASSAILLKEGKLIREYRGVLGIGFFLLGRSDVYLGQVITKDEGGYCSARIEYDRGVAKKDLECERSARQVPLRVALWVGQCAIKL